MYRQAVYMSPSKTPQQYHEVWFAMGLMIIGVILGIIGVWQSIADRLQAQSNPNPTDEVSG